MVAQLCIYWKHWLAHFKWVNFMLCELDFRKAVNKSSVGAWRCVTVEQTECECWNAIAVLLCACELPRYLIKCNFWSRRSGMDSEASVFKLSGCWWFWTVAHAQSSRWFFFFSFSEWGQSNGPFWIREDLASILQEGRMWFGKRERLKGQTN